MNKPFQVTVVHVNAASKNAADDKLHAAIRKFARHFQPPATVVLISGDVNFSTDLNDLRNCHKFNIVLVHNTWARESLKAFAHKTFVWEEFVHSVEDKKEQVSMYTK